jgi:hypothetical protein
LKWLFGQK